MKNSRRPKGDVSITKLPNGKLKMTLTLGKATSSVIDGSYIC